VSWDFVVGRLRSLSCLASTRHDHFVRCEVRQSITSPPSSAVCTCPSPYAVFEHPVSCQGLDIFHGLDLRRVSLYCVVYCNVHLNCVFSQGLYSSASVSPPSPQISALWRGGCRHGSYVTSTRSCRTHMHPTACPYVGDFALRYIAGCSRRLARSLFLLLED